MPKRYGSSQKVDSRWLEAASCVLQDPNLPSDGIGSDSLRGLTWVPIRCLPVPQLLFCIDFSLPYSVTRGCFEVCMVVYREVLAGIACTKFDRSERFCDLPEILEYFCLEVEADIGTVAGGLCVEMYMSDTGVVPVPRRGQVCYPPCRGGITVL